MKKYGWPLLMSAVLVFMVHFLYNTPLLHAPWMSAQGLDPDAKPPLEPGPFLAMFVAWTMYIYFYLWLYRRLHLSTLKEAVMITVGLWMFVSYASVTVHYLFLRMPWQLIVLDGLSLLTAKLFAGILLWALVLRPDPNDADGRGA